MDADVEEIWERRMRADIDISKIETLKDFKKEISGLDDSATGTYKKDGYHKEAGKWVKHKKGETYTIDLTHAKDMLNKHAESFFENSSTFQEDMKDKDKERIKDSDTVREIENVLSSRDYPSYPTKYIDEIGDYGKDKAEEIAKDDIQDSKSESELDKTFDDITSGFLFEKRDLDYLYEQKKNELVQEKGTSATKEDILAAGWDRRWSDRRLARVFGLSESEARDLLVTRGLVEEEPEEETKEEG